MADDASSPVPDPDRERHELFKRWMRLVHAETPDPADMFTAYLDDRNELYRFLAGDQEWDPPSGLVALLINDLREAYMQADHARRVNIFPLLVWLWNDVPAPAWGSLEKLRKWLAIPAEKRKEMMRHAR